MCNLCKLSDTREREVGENNTDFVNLLSKLSFKVILLEKSLTQSFAEQVNLVLQCHFRAMLPEQFFLLLQGCCIRRESCPQLVAACSAARAGTCARPDTAWERAGDSKAALLFRGIKWQIETLRGKAVFC